MALATLLLLTPLLLLAVLDGQPQAWKHAFPLTMRNITDAGSPILLRPRKSACTIPVLYFLLYLSLPDACQPTMASAKKIPTGPAAAAAAPSLPVKPTEDTPTYMISINHGLTANVGFWNARPLLQLPSRAQDHNGAPRAILVSLELAKLDALDWDISRGRPS